ncbi:uncharacterized [Tachysurus ichikawai]
MPALSEQVEVIAESSPLHPPPLPPPPPPPPRDSGMLERRGPVSIGMHEGRAMPDPARNPTVLYRQQLVPMLCLK